MSMIKKFAVDPATLSNYRDFRYVMEKFGYSTGRVLAALPKSWAKDILDRLDVGDIERARIVEKLRQYKEDRIVPSGVSYDVLKSWVENACEKRDVIPLHGIIASSVSKECERCRSLDSIDEGFFDVPREVQVPLAAKDLVSPAKLMLEHCRSVTLVDPYFAIHRPRNMNVLREIVGSAIQFGRCRRVVIIASEKQNPVGGERVVCREIEKYVRPITEVGFAVVVMYLDDAASKSKLHARYLLTDTCGLRYDKGFQESGPEELCDVSILDENIHRKIARIFLAGEHDMAVTAKYEWVSA